MSAQLAIMVGLPGSGKTTIARELVSKMSPGTAVAISRDDLRLTYYGTKSGLTNEQENEITALEHSQVEKALSRGLKVVVHDCNLRMSYRKAFAEIAERLGVQWAQVDMTYVPLETCLQRNAQRRHPVPEDVILMMHQRHIVPLQGKTAPEPQVRGKFTLPEHELYVPDTSLPGAVLVDIDGTVALHEGVRGPYDTSRYHLDRPNIPIIDMVRHEAYDLGNLIVFGSGRSEKFREVSMEWLYQEVKVPIAGCFMRPLGDSRNDAIVKLELFDKNIRGKFNIKRAYDDRNRVVDAYRSIGLTVLQVADGNF
jgi:predicted kinase